MVTVTYTTLIIINFTVIKLPPHEPKIYLYNFIVGLSKTLRGVPSLLCYYRDIFKCHRESAGE